jgi:phage baseplate assembly protein W
VLFEELDPALINRITSLIYDAILEHEPRVDLRGIDVTASDRPGELHIRIDYGIRGTNSRFNMVFPFYLNEAATAGS